MLGAVRWSGRRGKREGRGRLAIVRPAATPSRLPLSKRSGCLRRQSQDMMGFDIASLTPSAVDLTFSRLAL